MSRIVLPAKLASETVIVKFDFASRMSIGETLSGKATTAAVFSGVDPSPQGIVVASATSSGSVVSQKIGPSSAGTVYDLECTATTSLGQTITIGGYLATNPIPV